MYKYSLLENLLFPPVHLDMVKLGRKLQGKTILITGASSGIGEELACLLADMDVHLILVARREDKLKDMKSEIETKAAKVSVFRADLRNKEDMEALIAFIGKLHDGLDYIVSNAGKSIRRPIEDSLDRYHDFTRTMAVNYFAPVQLLLSAIPLLKSSGGHIINISTVNVLLIPFPYWAAYQASKSAFDTWLRSSAPELNSMGISTTSIYFPLVRTPMILPTPAYRNMPAMSSIHAARIICRAMYKEKRRYMPWWVIFGRLASVVFGGIWEILAPRIIKKSRRKA